MIEIDWQLLIQAIIQETLKWFVFFWNELILPIIDFIIVIELNNPAGEVALFIALIGIIITLIVGAIKLLPSLIQRYVFNEWH